MKNNSFLNLINDYILKRNFETANTLLRKQIIYTYMQKVQKYNKDYYYSTVTELLEELQKYSNNKDIQYHLFLYFYKIQNEDLLENDKTYKLLDIYENLQ